MVAMIKNIFLLLSCLFSSLLTQDGAGQPPNTTMPVTTTTPPPLQLPPGTVPTSLVSNRNQYTINASLPLSGEISVLGGSFLDGLSLFFNKTKTDQSLSFMYQLSALNDKGSSVLMKKNIKTQLAHSPLFIGFLGTDALSCAMPFVMDKKIAALFPFDGAGKHRRADNKNMIFWRAGHKRELEALVDYCINTLNKKKIAIFYEEGEWGEDCVASLEEILTKYDLTLVAKAAYPQKTLSLVHAVNKIAEKSPNAVVCIANARAAYNFIKQIINKGLYKTTILGISTLMSIQQPLKNSRGLRIITSSVVPDPVNSKLKIAIEYRTDMQKYLSNKTLSPFSFEGYIAAALLVECTKLVAPPLTTDRLITAIEGLANTKFKGLTLSFDTQTRTLCQDVWLNLGTDKKWIRYVPQTITKKVIKKKILKENLKEKRSS